MCTDIVRDHCLLLEETCELSWNRSSSRTNIRVHFIYNKDYCVYHTSSVFAERRARKMCRSTTALWTSLFMYSFVTTVKDFHLETFKQSFNAASTAFENCRILLWEYHRICLQILHHVIHFDQSNVRNFYTQRKSK